MDTAEKQITSETKYTGPIFTVTADRVLLPDGKTAQRDVVHHRGGVAVVAVDAENRVRLVSQYRYAQGETVREIVAGKREPDEEPLVTGQRELAEEAGLGAHNWTLLANSYPTPGYCSERIVIYLATDLYPSRLPKDADEFLSVEEIPLQKAVELVLDGTLSDAKTQTGILLAACRLGLLKTGK